jgi:outer membrane protein insertion porin family
MSSLKLCGAGVIERETGQKRHMTNEYLRGHIGTVLLAIAAFLMLSLVAPAGFVSQSQAATVSRISVVGNQRVDAETVGAYVRVQPGRSFSDADIDASLKALFETGLFSKVDIQQRGGTLVVTVAENPIINEIAFEGNKKYKDEQLETVIQSRPRGVFTRARVQADVQRILELYRRTGRFQASIEPKSIDLPKNRVNLVYEITEGPQTNVSRISFIGNRAFSDGKLRNIVDTKQSGLFGFLRSSDTYDPDRLSADEEKLRRHYLNRGHADFQVVSSIADFDRERNVFFISFTLDEGERYTFGVIDVDTILPGVDPATLLKLVETREGATFSSKAVEKSQEALTIELATSGYAFAQVRPRINRDPEARTIGVTYVIDEGPRAYIERINIIDNTRTRDYVIRREFEISEGDAFNRVLIDKAERRLNALGYFKTVRIVTEQGSAADRVVVNVIVEEQPTGELSFGAGYSTSDGVIGDISITERNFLGRGYVVRVAVGGGEDSRTYEFGVTDPQFQGRNVSAGFNVYRKDLGESDFRSYDLESTGGGVTFGLPITDNFTVTTGYKIDVQNVVIPGYPPGSPLTIPPCPVSLAICQIVGESVVSSVVYSLIYSTLDSKRDPHEGIYARFSQEYAGVGGDVNFLRTTGQASYYREIMPESGIVGMLKVQGGHIMAVGSDPAVRLTDVFFRGGESVRGFKSSGYGPRDSITGDALGGEISIAGTAEVVFPFPVLPPELGFRGAVFADAGTLFATSDQVSFLTGIGVIPIGDATDPLLRSSVGASVLWTSPFGPIRADFAYVLSGEIYDREQVFRFGGGTRF